MTGRKALPDGLVNQLRELMISLIEGRRDNDEVLLPGGMSGGETRSACSASIRPHSCCRRRIFWIQLSGLNWTTERDSRSTVPCVVLGGGAFRSEGATLRDNCRRWCLGSQCHGHTGAIVDVALPLSRARPDRVTRSNGYRHRDLDTRVGAIGVVPEPRQGGYVSDRLLRAPQARRDRPDHCRRRLPPRWRVQAPHGSPDAHCAHIASGPRLVKTPGISFPSKSRVSRTATRLDEHVRPAPPPPPGQGRAGARGTWSQSNHIRRGPNRTRPAGSRGSNEEWPPSMTAATE